MTRRLALALALLAAAALMAAPSPAAAKQLRAVTACGTGHCVTTRDRPVLDALLEGGTPSVPRAHRARSILLRGHVVAGGQRVGTWRAAWVPRLHMLVGEDGTWMAVPRRSVRALERLTAGLRTRPPSALHRLGVAPPEPPAPAPVASVAPSPPEPPAPEGTSAWLLLVPGGALLAGAAALLAFRKGV